MHLFTSGGWMATGHIEAVFMPAGAPSTACATALIAASAAVIFLLGLVHLVYTFKGSGLHPRDPNLQQRMSEDSPNLTRQTTMWKAWVGFNASHSLGALLFGCVFGYLSIFRGPLLLQSDFLLFLSLLTLGGYTVLAQRFWFKAPFRGIVLATVLYALALVLAKG